MPSTVAEVPAHVHKATPILKTVLAELAQLSNPATDAAIVALVVKVLPGVHFDVTDVLGVMGGVGIISQWVRSRFKGGLAGLAVSLGDVLPATATSAPGVVVNVHPPATAAAVTVDAAPAASSTPAATS